MSSEEFIKTWNICDELKKHKELQNRTNNALERYNRSMNENFPLLHPTLKEFVSTLEKEGRNQVTRLEKIKHGITEAPNYKDLTLDEVLDCYIAFKP